MRRSAVLSAPVLAALMVPVAALGVGTSDWIDGFRTDVERCWNPPEGSAVVIVTFGMNRDGTVIGDSLRSIPREMAETDSFTAARRAILRCGRDGYDLPPDQYEAWREIEMTFDPLVGGEQ
ncbi:hypothetical protein XM53_07420 [Roseovarius atlanticus]|uniref:Energy transducer TonB n=1 Tax=Roseovarius atlanticus TaxID=1641875 RepID=A0A0T5NVL6_9RHOB|nr:cell envelope integrity protein TolA [Roseovarius atlanticus]KRS12984.1 hypothetical protein XM53_07420 [Roseovarius atlanticus]